MLAGGSRSTRSISFPAAIFTAPVSSVATGLDLDPEGLLRAIELRDGVTHYSYGEGSYSAAYYAPIYVPVT